jgi:hypothetical protein
MAYDEALAARIRGILGGHRGITEKKMFGGLCFLLNGKMCCGVLKRDLVARVPPEEYEFFLRKPGVRPMDFTGRPMKGFVYVAPEGYRTDLACWVERCLAFVSSVPESSRNRPMGRKGRWRA